MDIFIDESGDLGFTRKSSNFFIVSYLMVDNSISLHNYMKKLLRKMHKKRIYSGSEFKFTNSNHATRLECLQLFLTQDWTSGIIVLEKRRTNPGLRSNTNMLYNYVIVHNVIKNILSLVDPNEDINIYVDRSLSKLNRDSFDRYIEYKASWIWNIKLNKASQLRPDQIKIKHVNSEKDNCIQLSDYIAGAAFQKYERNNDVYYNTIEKRIIKFDYLW